MVSKDWKDVVMWHSQDPARKSGRHLIFLPLGCSELLEVTEEGGLLVGGHERVGGNSVPFLMAMHLFFNRIWNPDLRVGQIVPR